MGCPSMRNWETNGGVVVVVVVVKKGAAASKLGLSKAGVSATVAVLYCEAVAASATALCASVSARSASSAQLQKGETIYIIGIYCVCAGRTWRSPCPS